jgi:hypothetical protein
MSRGLAASESSAGIGENPSLSSLVTVDGVWLALVASGDRLASDSIPAWVPPAAGALAAALVGAGAKGLLDSFQWNRTERHTSYLGLLTAADTVVATYQRAWARRDIDEHGLSLTALEAALEAARAFDMAVTRVRLVGRGMLVEIANEMTAIAQAKYWEGISADSPYRDRPQREGEESDAFDTAQDEFLELYQDFADRARLDLGFWPSLRLLIMSRFGTVIF